MTRRLRRIGTALLFLGVNLVLTGCESMRQSFRGHDKEHLAKLDHEHESESGGGSDEVRDIKSPATKKFFKDSRLSGAMSDEGREIERDLGIH